VDTPIAMPTLSRFHAPLAPQLSQHMRAPSLRPDLSALLARYEPIGLGEMQSAALMDRIDTKYVMTTRQLGDLLVAAEGGYRALEVAGTRRSRYESLYYDTEDLVFYTSHHAGRSARYKVRRRSYTDSNLSFLEVKHKTNKGRTIKERIRTERFVGLLGAAKRRFVERMMPGGPPPLQPVLWNTFARITLVSRTTPERVTIDTALNCWTDRASVSLDGVVIAEVKQQHLDRLSPIVQELRALGLRSTGISKYCVGTALLYRDVKQNRFRPILRQIDRIMEGSIHGK